MFQSPRWLLSRGRSEEARTALSKLRAESFSDEDVEHELIATQFTLDKESERGKFRELWQGVNLKRTLLVMAVNFCQQATGQAFASQYGAIFIKSLGTVNPFDMTLINAAINSVTLLLCMGLIDKVGRKSVYARFPVSPNIR
jgi:SP family sugar:H+ symporter-like MFS transporter